jgi:lysophospholipase L1-like esterase
MELLEDRCLLSTLDSTFLPGPGVTPDSSVPSLTGGPPVPAPGGFDPGLAAWVNQIPADTSLSPAPAPGAGTGVNQVPSGIPASPLPGPAVVVLGDSIMDFFAHGVGAGVWDQEMAPLGAADLAVSGSTTQDVMGRINQGDLNGLSPRVVVLLIGTNDLGRGASPEQTAAGVAACVADIHAHEPQASILLLGILPRNLSPFDPIRAGIVQVNSLIASLDNGGSVRYLDLGSAFVQPDGSISTDLLYDYVHPTPVGYSILTALIKPTLVQMLGLAPPGKTPTVVPVSARGGWTPVTGDWDGDGTTNIGVVDPSSTWHLRIGPGGATALTFPFGPPGSVPVVGDWDGSGHVGIGVVDPLTAMWYLRDSVGPGPPDHVFQYGVPGWEFVAGDWSGSGHTGIGVFNPWTDQWLLRNDSSPGFPDFIFAFGVPGMRGVAGDWTGAGRASVGVVDTTTMTWVLLSPFTQGDLYLLPLFQYGGAHWFPVVGDWVGNGNVAVGAVDPYGDWFLRAGVGPLAGDFSSFFDGLGPALWTTG